MDQPVQAWSAKQGDAQSQLQAHLAFHLTGKRSIGGLDAIGKLDLRPALFAGYRDLTALRYDFPLVLVRGVTDTAAVQSLSGLFDGLGQQLANGAEGERLQKHALRLERMIRTLVADGASGSLSDVWAEAARQLARQGNELPADSLDRLRGAIKVDGDLLDCNSETALRLCRHLWQAVHDGKAWRLRARLGVASMKLSDILRADLARSEQGRSAERLSESFGTTHREAFDFAAMSRLLSEASPPVSLSDSRRRRIRWLISVLTSQRFFPAEAEGAGRGESAEPYGFVFERCADAIAAYRERLPKIVELAKALAMAELEVNGEYREARHDSFFADFGVANLDLADFDAFPDYLICVRAGAMQPDDYDALLEAFSTGLRAKVLVAIDDILRPLPSAGDNLVFDWRGKQVARTVMDLNAFYVLQSSASSLFALRDAMVRGMTFSGSSLFSIYTGATGNPDLSPYLIAAAATEARAFPTFIYDPSAGPDWASRFRLADNPQAERDWPVQAMSYEDEAHQRLSDSVAFTLVDFVACDQRYGKHFARVPRANWTSSMVPLTEFLGPDVSEPAGKVPYLMMVDRDDRLQKVIVDESLVREARRCADMWRSLQELGGIRNSHAAKLLAQERELWERQRPQAAASAPPSAEVTPVVAPVVAPDAAPAAASDEAQAAKPSDDPYIETPRCTTCNECTQVNDRMFAYDANKQAFIADPDAGTYRQLVEAAESCQVAIIHPGKPRNPDEPGLDELLKRAEPFL